MNQILDISAPSRIKSKLFLNSSWQGLLIALSIIIIWATSLSYLLMLDISDVPLLWLLPGMLLQTFLYTGLFITAHDAMHGVVFPKNRKINDLLGTTTLILYALFSFKQLTQKHWQHHNHLASELDPDFHAGKQNFLAWYLHFMRKYWSWSRIIGLMIIFNLAILLLNLPEKNLTLFWVIPAILSSVQLFFFGTYLPHREPKTGYTNVHRAQTNPLPIFWSFISCYHFGYHEEHHEYPHIPWWQLPKAYQMRK